MELNQLQCFLAVAQTGNITKAAEKLYITQSALSRVIQRLEAELNVPLFDRTHKKISLNENGRLFQFYISQALKDIEMGVSAICVSSARDTMPFRIRNDLVTDILTSVYDICQAEYPQMNLQFCRYYGDSDNELDDNDPPDILISSIPDSMGTTSVEVFREKWCIIAERSRAKGMGNTVSLQELAEMPIVFFGSDADLRFIRDFFMSSGISPGIVTVDSSKRSAAFVNKGLAVACVPISLCCEYDSPSSPNIPFSPVMIADAPFERSIYLCKSLSIKNSEAQTELLNRILERLRQIMQAAELFEQELLK